LELWSLELWSLELWSLELWSLELETNTRLKKEKSHTAQNTANSCGSCWRPLFSFLFLLFSTYTVTAQDTRLAENYADNGEFEKALSIYNKVLEKQPRNFGYVLRAIEIHQELEQYSKVDSLLNMAEKYSRNTGQLSVERGYNFSLQGKNQRAQENYEKAISAIDSLPSLTYSTAYQFQQRGLLDQAIAAYEKGMALDDRLRYDAQLATLYGEKGELEKMFTKYLDLIETNASYRPRAQAIFSRYVSEDADSEGNQKLRRALLLRSRENQDPLYNQLLSWLYVQQQDYGKAFTQEKAIYLRDRQDISGMRDLALAAADDEQYTAALNIFDYLIEENNYPALLHDTQARRLKVKTEIAGRDSLVQIKTEYENFIVEYGRKPQTFDLQYDYAEFLSFKLGLDSEAIQELTQLLDQQLNKFPRARAEMLMADILVKQEQFNRALLLYSKIQNDLPNDELAQQAQFKVARTSYFQGDFDWALTQLKVLGSATSKLIANDALELKLLIKDNIQEDTLGVALSAFAKAQLKTYQNQFLAAKSQLAKDMPTLMGTSVEDEAYLLQGDLYQKLDDPQAAVESYEKIIAKFPEEITADDALYRASLLYLEKLGNTERAKELLETFIFNHADSIYFTDARARYRKLRGDTNTKAF